MRLLITFILGLAHSVFASNPTPEQSPTDALGVRPVNEEEKSDGSSSDDNPTAGSQLQSAQNLEKRQAAGKKPNNVTVTKTKASPIIIVYFLLLLTPFMGLGIHQILRHIKASKKPEFPV